MVDNVKVGIVGLGLVSSSHIKGFQAHPGAEVVAVCDLNEARAKAVAEEFGIEKYYTSFDEMLADPDINTVSIATPTFTHRPLAVAAAEAGKHIMCEKPLALGIDDARAICEAAETNGVTLAVEESYVFMTSLLKARELIDAGAIGKPQQMRQRFGAWVDRPGVLDAILGEGGAVPAWREDSAKAGGNGYPWLFDHNMHFFAAAQFLMGDSPITEIHSLKADNSWLKADPAVADEEHQLYGVTTGEDVPLMTWRHEDPACLGVWARAEHLNGKHDFMTGFSLAVFGDQGMIEVLGEGGGGLQWNGEQVHLVLHRADGSTETFRFDEPADEVWVSEVSYYSHAHINCIGEFVDALTAGREPSYSGRDGLRDLQATIASICSAREGVPVRVAEATDARLHQKVGGI
jgi:predicted dehydrogenase